MSAVLRAAASAAFTGVASLALGLCILRKLAVSLTRLEEYLFGFLAGSAALSLAVFLFTAIHLAYTAVFVSFGVATIAIWITRFRDQPKPERSACGFPKWWFLFALLLCLPYAELYLSRALGPEYSPDGITYHVALIARYLREHHFPIITTKFYASFPEALEMLFLFAFSIGKHSAAASTHLLFLFATAAALIGFGLRFNAPKAGIAAAAVFFMAPIVGWDASISYVDVAEACACFALFYAIEIWRQHDDHRMLAVAGIMAGFAAAIKYTGFIAIPFSLAVVAWHVRKRHGQWKRCLPLLVLPEILLVAPWLIKNVVEVRNPVSPFFNRLFPNPYVYVCFEDEYTQGLSHPNNITWSEFPLELTVHGERLQGLFGPLLLLAPLGLLALRWPIGRQILVAGLVFALPYPANPGSRFLIPAIPFFILAMAITLSHWRFTLPAALVFHFLVCEPAALEEYASPRAMRLERAHWDETLRERPETEVLAARIEAYGLMRFIDANLAAGARIYHLGAGEVPAVYMKQVVDGEYEGALNYKVRNMMWSAVFKEMQPTWRDTFSFKSTRLASIRVRQVAESDAIWTVSELRFYREGRELMPQPDWQFKAQPFPWDVHLAFDRNPVTSWRAWQKSRPGMFVKATFHQPIEVDRVTIDGPRDQPDIRLLVEGEDPAGHAVALSSEAVRQDIPLPDGWRLMIGNQLKSYGYTHLLIDKSAPVFDDIRDAPGQWGMTLVTEQRNYRLYQLP